MFPMFFIITALVKLLLPSLGVPNFGNVKLSSADERSAWGLETTNDTKKKKNTPDIHYKYDQKANVTSSL